MPTEDVYRLLFTPATRPFRAGHQGGHAPGLRLTLLRPGGRRNSGRRSYARPAIWSHHLIDSMENAEEQPHRSTSQAAASLLDTTRTRTHTTRFTASSRMQSARGRTQLRTSCRLVHASLRIQIAPDRAAHHMPQRAFEGFSNRKHAFLAFFTGLVLAVLQYEVNPWKGRGRPQPPFRLTKIGIISLQSVGLRSRD